MLCHCGCNKESDGKYFIENHHNLPAMRGKKYEDFYTVEKSKEIKSKQSIANKNRPSWNKGLTKKTDERVKLICEKISIKNKGKLRIVRETRFCACGCNFSKIVKIHSNWKYKSGHNNRGRKYGCLVDRLGIKKANEIKDKMRKAKLNNPTKYWLNKIRTDMRGSNHFGWNASKSHYGTEFDRKLKNFVLYRDKYLCQLCGNYNKRLFAHHIDYKKFNNKQENLVTLCNSCHSKTNFDRNTFTNLFRLKTLERQNQPISYKEMDLPYIT